MTGRGYDDPEAALIPRYPHHILHKYQAPTASPWPRPPDMLIDPYRFRLQLMTGRPFKRFAAVGIFRR